MKRLRKAVLISVILCSCVGCDQATKLAAQNHLTSSQPVYWMGDVFRFQYTTNKGAFLGLGAEMPDSVRFWALVVLVGIALIGALWFVLLSQKMNHPVDVLGVSLTIGGGLSNLVDRLLNDGAVVDFVNVGVGRLRTGVFNLADVAILIGPGVLVVWNVLSGATGEPKNE